MEPLILVRAQVPQPSKFFIGDRGALQKLDVRGILTEMEADKEIKAIADILASLEGLDLQARERVFKYVIERMGVQVKMPSTPFLETSYLKEGLDRPFSPNSAPGLSSDIRSLKDQKQPETAIQMAVLVAYYLQEVASPEERKESIGVDDIQKYFKQAGFALPKIPISALKNAKAAGYLESADRGTYKLNPVGYNLIAHGLPSKGGAVNGKRSKKQPRAGKTKKK